MSRFGLELMLGQEISRKDHMFLLEAVLVDPSRKGNAPAHCSGQCAGGHCLYDEVLNQGPDSMQSIQLPHTVRA